MMNRFGDIECSFKRLPPVYGYHSEEIVSIEKALKNIEPQIKELSRYIKIAKKNCHYPSEHGLTKDQAAAIYIYTMEWGKTTLYRVLNDALRSENRQALKIWFPYMKLFDTALNLLPTVKETVWRGIPVDIGKNFVKNKTITWWSINSCSSSVNVIKQFLGDEKTATLFSIETINGKKISGYTEYESEDEIILRMGTQFRVKSDVLELSNGIHIVHLIEINDDDDDDDMVSSVTSAVENLDVPTTPSTESVSKKEEFAKHGAYKELSCKGRHCAKCGKCRDWYYTGDASSWQWIRNVKTWKGDDWDTWRDECVSERFKKRDGATCGGGDGRHLLRGYAFGGGAAAVGGACLCEDNNQNTS